MNEDHRKFVEQLLPVGACGFAYVEGDYWAAISHWRKQTVTHTSQPLLQFQPEPHAMCLDIGDADLMDIPQAGSQLCRGAVGCCCGLEAAGVCIELVLQIWEATGNLPFTVAVNSQLIKERSPDVERRDTIA